MVAGDPPSLNRVCVFAGSNPGHNPAYAEATRTLAVELANRGIGIVYGGGSIGLMGILADAALAAGGDVIGVIPKPIATPELAHTRLTELRVVAGMHERKATMAQLSDAFITLPGGFGTFEETLEVITWSQLGIQTKPVALLNLEGYFNGLKALFGHAVQEGFLRPEYLDLLFFAATVPELLDRLTAWRPPTFSRVWLSASQT